MSDVLGREVLIHCSSVWSCYHLLCLPTESRKDILAATGNYTQPEVTTLTWRWLAVKRRKSGTVLQLRTLFIRNDIIFFFSFPFLVVQPEPARGTNFCCRFIVSARIYMLPSILHVVHDLWLCDVFMRFTHLLFLTRFVVLDDDITFCRFDVTYFKLQSLLFFCPFLLCSPSWFAVGGA